MNQTEYPSLGNAVSGFVFHKQDSTLESRFDQTVLEIECVNLISNLEYFVAKARDMARGEFVDESAVIGRQMLERLSTFSKEFLEGKALLQIKEEIDRSLTFCYTYDEVLKTRPLANAIFRTFWKVEECEEIKAAHTQLGEVLIRCCATTFYHAVVLIGNESESCRQIDQSTLVLVNEMQIAWN